MDEDDIDNGETDPDVLAENDALVRLATLKAEHEILDSAVLTLQADPLPDQIQLARLKKRKLVLRDEIVRLEDMTTPDIIA
jgi:hypothetical protein